MYHLIIHWGCVNSAPICLSLIHSFVIAAKLEHAAEKKYVWRVLHITPLSIYHLISSASRLFNRRQKVKYGDKGRSDFGGWGGRGEWIKLIYNVPSWHKIYRGIDWK